MAAVVRRGADEAGAILVIVDRLDGTVDLYGPAPQSAFADSRPADRLFQLLMSRSERAAIDARLADELQFDPDLWVVEVEDRSGRAFLDLTES
jgi:hypothetical protein